MAPVYWSSGAISPSSPWNGYDFCFGVRQLPRQQIIVSSLQHQVQAPQQSPFLYLLVLSSSQTMKAENTDRLVRNSIRTPKPAKAQKLDRASKDDVHPKKKAIALVTEVIVTEDPA